MITADGAPTSGKGDQGFASGTPKDEPDTFKPRHRRAITDQ